MLRLKVFRTTSGFYDHVVAAPSRPAALKAWGAKTAEFFVLICPRPCRLRVARGPTQTTGNSTSWAEVGYSNFNRTNAIAPLGSPP